MLFPARNGDMTMELLDLEFSYACKRINMAMYVKKNINFICLNLVLSLVLIFLLI